MSLMTFGAGLPGITSALQDFSTAGTTAAAVPAGPSSSPLPGMKSAIDSFSSAAALAASVPATLPDTPPGLAAASMTDGGLFAFKPNLLWLGVAGAVLVAGIVYWRKGQ